MTAASPGATRNLSANSIAPPPPKPADVGCKYSKFTVMTSATLGEMQGFRQKIG